MFVVFDICGIGSIFMSGHSKWSTIKRQKGANDLKRGQQFTKLSMAIAIAVREGGSVTDPASNFRLRLAIEAARNANMPKENIERAINRAAGPDGAVMEEAVYEGFAPHGVSVIVQAVTDNKNRTTPEIKNLFEKNGGTLGNPGSVSYLFQNIGQIILKKSQPFDDIFMTAVDSGAADVEEAGEEVFVYTSPDDLSRIRESLIAAGLEVLSVEHTRKPVSEVTLAAQAAADKVMEFLEKLDDHADVQKVYANVSFA